jgi:feruloyl-CoA synthase
MSTAIRDVNLGRIQAQLERRADGTQIVRSTQPLPQYPDKLTARLDHWANVTPKRAFIAQRGPDGGWRQLTYEDARDQARGIGQALIDRGLSAERGVAILSDNDIEHALLALAALYVGVPYAPISPPYALVSSDFGKLRHVLGLFTPGLVFAANGARFERPLRAVVPKDVEVVTGDDPPAGLNATRFEDLAATRATAAVDAAHAGVGPETIAKILFTSGSTGLPKGVINTQRMLCSNQAMLAHYFAFFRDEPPVLVDWLPWNHTFGGNHNFGLVLYNGGTLWIDEGKPVPNGIEKTVQNLREVAPTIYFNVPKGFEMLVPYLREDEALRRRFFSRLNMMFYSGAGMPQHLWDDLERLEIEACGERIAMRTGLGATESAPFALVCSKEVNRPGAIGLPVPGVELKLVPSGDKLEARLKGPNITPGYWRQADLTRKAFDEEGFYCLGDAVRFLDPTDPNKGFLFDGRISEDFKLITGTWVSVGVLRAEIIRRMAPFVSDVVIAGHDRNDIRILIFPDLFACRDLCLDFARDVSPAELLARPEVREKFQTLVDDLASTSTGSSTRIAAAILADEPASLDKGEITDKGSLNQRAVLQHRNGLVEELYGEETSPRVIVARSRK